MKLLMFLAVTCGQVLSISCLDCYSCHSVTAISECHQVDVCHGTDDLCFTESTVTGGSTTYHLGCRPSQESNNYYKESNNYYKEHNNYYKEPNNYYKEHNNYYKEHKNYYKKPNNYYKEHNNYYKEPNNYYKVPNNYYKEPNNYYKEHNNYYKVPNNYYKEPNNYYKEPNNYSKEHNNYYKEHNSYYKEPNNYYKEHNYYYEETNNYNKEPNKYYKDHNNYYKEHNNYYKEHNNYYKKHNNYYKEHNNYYKENRRTLCGTVSPIVLGRDVERRASPDCDHCCHTDACNKHLCAPADNFLLFTDTNRQGLFRMDITTHLYVQIPIQGSNPIAIDYDGVDGRIYWTDVALQLIRSAKLDGSDEKTIRTLSSNAVPDGISVDPVSRLVFYTDTGNDIIGLMKMDGSDHVTIINSGLDEPRAIVLDVFNGIMYWSDWGSSPKIESSNYDGSNRKTIISTGLRWPNALAIDVQGGKLYWADGGNNHIEVVNLDGSNRHVLHTEFLGHLFGIALLENTLFYSDWMEKTIMSISTSGSTTASHVGPPDFGRINGVHVHKKGFSPSGENACTNAYGGCGNICVPVSGDNKKCLCPDGMTLQSDQVTCASSGRRKREVTNRTI